MSFIIRGGYDIFRKQVLNLTLRRTDKWAQGLIMIRQNKFVCGLVPLNENKLEIIRFNDMHALLLNDTIIYEDKKIFGYKIELETSREPDLTDKNLYNFVECNYVDYQQLKWVDTHRYLN